MLPTFIGIGPGRAATSMIYEFLLEHPEVALASGTKETNFFNYEYHRGIDWYEKFYRNGNDIKAVGEISNNYFYDPKAPERMYSLLPHVRLFTCLRNPYERLRSVYIYRKRAGEIPANMNLETALAQYPDLITGSYYYDHLQQYYRYFPKHQVLILFYDDLLDHPKDFICQLLDFIGVHRNFKSKTLYKKINESSEPKSLFLGNLTGLIVRTLRRTGNLAVLDKLKRSSFIRKMVLRPTKIDCEQSSLALRSSTVKHLKERWEPQISGIEHMTGRKLTHWCHSPS